MFLPVASAMANAHSGMPHVACKRPQWHASCSVQLSVESSMNSFTEKPRPFPFRTDKQFLAPPSAVTWYSVIGGNKERDEYCCSCSNVSSVNMASGIVRAGF